MGNDTAELIQHKCDATLCTVDKMSQHWHAFALSPQIHICYTEDAQIAYTTESDCEQTPNISVCFLHQDTKEDYS